MFQFRSLVSGLPCLAADLERVRRVGPRPRLGRHRLHRRHASSGTFRKIHGHSASYHLSVSFKFCFNHGYVMFPNWTKNLTFWPFWLDSNIWLHSNWNSTRVGSGGFWVILGCDVVKVEELSTGSPLDSFCIFIIELNWLLFALMRQHYNTILAFNLSL